MSVEELHFDRNQMIRHAWIADLSRYYSVTSTASYDIVMIQTNTLFDGIPVALYIRPFGTRPDATFVVDDGGFCWDRALAMMSTSDATAFHMNLSNRIRRTARSHGVTFNNTVIRMQSKPHSLRDTIDRVAYAVLVILQTVIF